MCMCEYTDSPVYCDECREENVMMITVKSEVFIDHPKYGTPVWAQVEAIDDETGEVMCIGDDGEELFAKSIDDLEIYSK